MSEHIKNRVLKNTEDLKTFLKGNKDVRGFLLICINSGFSYNEQTEQEDSSIQHDSYCSCIKMIENLSIKECAALLVGLSGEINAAKDIMLEKYGEQLEEEIKKAYSNSTYTEDVKLADECHSSGLSDLIDILKRLEKMGGEQ